MRPLIVCALAVVAFIPSAAFGAGASPAPVDTAAPSNLPTPNAATIQALARRCLVDIEGGTIDRSLFTDGANAELTGRVVELLSQNLARLGPPGAFELQAAGHSGNTATFMYRVSSRDGHYFMIYNISFDVARNRVQAMHFGPVERQ